MTRRPQPPPRTHLATEPSPPVKTATVTTRARPTAPTPAHTANSSPKPVRGATGAASDGPDKPQAGAAGPRKLAALPPIDRNGLTLDELRTLTNLDKTYTSRVLRRKFTASLRGVRRLAAAIEISVHEFCFRARYTAFPPPKGPFGTLEVLPRGPMLYGGRVIERQEIMTALGWDEGYLSRVVRGKQIPGTANALRLAEFLGCSLDWLIDQLHWR